jgi:DNA polymerase theta
MSATLPNLNLLAKWLNASLYQTNFRPVPLIECIKYGNNLFDNSLKLVREIEIYKDIDSDNDLLLHLTYETISSRLGVLIFCPTKARCEAIAENIAKMVYS